MADVQLGGGGGKGKGVKSKKMSTNVDLTPMVDLAFLLITFFMLTTTLQKPQTLQINMPKKVDKPDEKFEIPESKVLTIIPTKDNNVVYYEGITTPTFLNTNYGKDGIRKVIMDKQNKVAQKWGSKDETIVMIKPDSMSTYKNMVDILDEMSITGIKIYAMTDISDIENESVADILQKAKEVK